MGPVLIFDKSTLQSLSVDETVWLHAFYSASITPLFFVETLADLEKEVRKGRTPEEIVGNLALKTAPTGARPNVHHLELCRGELLGSNLEMTGRIVVSDARAVVTANGSGVLFRPSPEEEALQRWQKGEFLTVERHFARSWRKTLAELDLSEWKLSVRAHPKPRSLVEAKEIALRVVNRDGSRYRTLQMALTIFDVPAHSRRDVLRRWKSNGGPSITRFAPYVAHVLTVDTFFGLALQAGLISPERPSNRVDIAYLYYLPFCMVFTSNDNLHERTVPIFLRTDQRFLKGADLKADLAKLDAHYSTLPEETLQQGVMQFAHYPPTEGEFLTSAIWDQLMSPKWREDSMRPAPSKEVQDALLELVNKMSEEVSGTPPGKVDVAKAGGVVVESRVPLRMGKWKLFPPEVEEKVSGKGRAK